MDRVHAGEVLPAARPEVVRLPGNRATIVGRPDQLGSALTQLRESGRLAAASDPVPDGRPGMYAVTVRLAGGVQPRPTPQRFWTRRRAALAVGVAVAILTALAWLVYVVVTWIAAHMLAIVVALVIVAVLSAGGWRACKTVVTVTHRH